MPHYLSCPSPSFIPAAGFLLRRLYRYPKFILPAHGRNHFPNRRVLQPALLQYSAKMANDCLAGTTRLYYCIQSNVLCQCFFKKMCFLFFRQAAARAESPLPRLCRTIACSIQKLPYIQHPPALLIPGKPQIRSRILQLSLTLFICHTGKFLKEQS